jgi:hypothetical protein
VAIITRELADKIAKKLRAQIRSKGKAHDYALVYHGGKLIASFGIRRGSKKSLGHDHVPGRLYISPRQARLLGQCPLKRAGWLAILDEKGKL